MLCEDIQHAAFAVRFFERCGWNKRQITIRKVPGGMGSGEAFVRENYVKELKEYRKNRNRVSRGLILCTDGDADGWQKRLVMLQNECEQQQIEPRTKDEAVALFIPTWNIETWLAYLSGETVDETRNNYPRLKSAKECGPNVDALFAMCQSRLLREPAPDSLRHTCEEFQRFVENSK
jgi:hypothetical protein